MFEVDLKLIIRLLINVFIKLINDQIFNTMFDELKEVKFSERNKRFEESQRSKILCRKKGFKESACKRRGVELFYENS